jgi:glutathione synthase/RimK-type ligase-like ATP-grasp enzyme
MTRILVPTYPTDIHATVVADALATLGHEAVLWQGADFPARQQASVTIASGEDALWEISGPALEIGSSSPFDVVWYRRPVLDPVLPEGMHPGDLHIARRECRAFIRGLWQLIAPNALWINPPGSHDRASKLAQLREASAVGLAVPTTLCSNDPNRIREFICRFRKEVIYKAFAPAQWVRDNGVALAATSEVDIDDLPDDDILRLTPGIFQRRIEKSHELRLTYMGAHLVAASLLSQEVPSGRLDWRMAFDALKVAPASVPAHVDRRCRALLERLGLIFGCIDLIVTPEGEYIFLEINEMGQFLWVEELNPEILMLDPFCEFLIQARSDFLWPRSRRPLRFDELLELRGRRLRSG